MSFERSADYIEQSIARSHFVLLEKKLLLQYSPLLPCLALIQRLRDLDPPGRQVITADPLKIKSDPKLDFSLQDGDRLIIPSRPTQVTVVGEVINPSSLTFRHVMQAFQITLLMLVGLKDTADTKKVYS